MSKFQPGDRVIVVKTNPGQELYFSVGYRGTIRELDRAYENGHEVYLVDFDLPAPSYGYFPDNDWFVSDEEIELISRI